MFYKYNGSSIVQLFISKTDIVDPSEIMTYMMNENIEDACNVIKTICNELIHIKQRNTF